MRVASSGVFWTNGLWAPAAGIRSGPARPRPLVRRPSVPSFFTPLPGSEELSRPRSTRREGRFHLAAPRRLGGGGEESHANRESDGRISLPRGDTSGGQTCAFCAMKERRKTIRLRSRAVHGASFSRLR